MPPAKKDTTLTIQKVQTGIATFSLKGRTPLIYNAVSEKARHELLYPAGKKGRAEKLTSVKHHPLNEYRGSVYGYRDTDDSPTRLYFPASAFKRSMMTAALDMPGVTKASIGRLMWVVGDRTPIWGIPELFMSVVRSADMNKTPDIRTRAILPEWCAEITVQFAQPILGPQQIANLLQAAGDFVGVGDFRQEKGAGSYGQFDIVSGNDKMIARLRQTADRAVQDGALADPQCYDDESDRLLAYWNMKFAEQGARAKLIVGEAIEGATTVTEELTEEEEETEDAATAA